MTAFPASLSRGRSAAPLWIAELLPIGLVGLHVLAVYAVAAWIGEAHRIAWTLYLAYAGPALLALFCAGLAALSVMALRRHPGTPLATALRCELDRRDIDTAALFRGLPLLVLLPVFLSLFSSFKTLIPKLNPFTWDIAFAELDRALHGGIDPWRYFEPVLAQPIAVHALDFLYHPAWSLGLFALWGWQAVDRRRPKLRLQFLLALPAVWIVVGSIGGTIFSSAGPCYFPEVGGSPDRFAPLMTRLAELDADWPMASQAAQRALWELYRSNTIGFGSGISAMPSVHVATAFVAVLLARPYGRMSFMLAMMFFLAICIGSVALGWHYAIDAYAGVLLACPLWLACGALARRVGMPRGSTPTP